MLQQDFHRGNNPAYDRVAFVAEHYEELVFMYKDILEHLKQGGTGTGGGGCTHISKQVESPYGFVQLDKESFKLIGYDLDNPDDIQFLLHNTSVIQQNGANPPPYRNHNYTSNGIEYHDTYEVSIGREDTILSRDSVLDDLLDNPSMLQKAYAVDIDIEPEQNQIISDISIIKGDFKPDDKEAFLRSIYQRLITGYAPDRFLVPMQNKPIALRIRTYSDEVLYEKISDSVENNPIYVGKTPEKIVTYNNVLIFPVAKYTKYGQSSTLKIKAITPFQVYVDVVVAGMGDTIKCIKDDSETYYYPYGNLALSADLPEILGEHSDTHTFTITIDPDIKDDY